MSLSRASKNHPIVTLASQLLGAPRPFPQSAYATAGELQSLHARLHSIIQLAAHMSETLETIRCRAEKAASQ